jgi:hypothetical protein
LQQFGLLEALEKLDALEFTTREKITIQEQLGVNYWIDDDGKQFFIQNVEAANEEGNKYRAIRRKA